MFDANVAELSRHRMSGCPSPIRSPFDIRTLNLFLVFDELGDLTVAVPTLEGAEMLLGAFDESAALNHVIVHRLATLSAPVSQEGGAA